MEEREVDTEVKLFLFFPFQVRVDVACASVSWLPNAISRPHVVRFIRSDGISATKVVITSNTVSSTYFQVIDPCNLLHKLLFADAPACRDSPEVTPTIIYTKLRTSFTTEAHRCHVFVIVWIITTCKEWHQSLAWLFIRVHACQTVWKICTSANIPTAYSVNGKVSIGHIKRFTACLIKAPAQYGINAMNIVKVAHVRGISFYIAILCLRKIVVSTTAFISGYHAKMILVIV